MYKQLGIKNFVPVSSFGLKLALLWPSFSHSLTAIIVQKLTQFV